jgi:aryl-alcohol dehydrogenase-like predicted oxidoreductase
MKPSSPQLGLGTVQFGLDYGISNKTGKTSRAEVSAILEYAKSCGLQFMDTAPAYGNSEKLLGELLFREDDFKIITKSIPMNSDTISAREADALERGYHQSLENLRKEHLYGFLCHDPDDLLHDQAGLLWKRMEAIQRAGLVQRIGVSVYSKEELDPLLSRYPIELIQVPLNVLDQRFLQIGYLDQIHKRGIEIHARSVFLQGLLVLDPLELSPHFDGVKNVLKRFRDFSNNIGLSPLAAALGFLKQIPEIDVIICGVNDGAQLKEIVSAYANYNQTLDFSAFAFSDISILNPSNWP